MNAIRSTYDKLKSYIFARQQAYNLVFDPESVHVQRVLADLARFCRANEPAFHSDPRIHATLEGRREVFLRIQKHLRLTPEQLFKTYTGKEANE